MTRKDKDELISFFRDAEGYDWRELLHEYCYDVLKDDTEFAGEIDILSVSEQGDDYVEKPVKNLDDFVRELYAKIIEGVCNVIETQDDGWIPVSEELPENYRSVIVQWEKSICALNETQIFYDIMCIDSMGEWSSKYGIPNGKVVAWMPLPESSYKNDK